MGWQSITFAVPPAAVAIHDGFGPVVSGISGEVAGAQARLAAVTGGAVAQASPLAASASGVVALREALEALVASGGRMVAVHPYIHPAGDRRGDYSYLTPVDCVAALAAKLTDAEDLPEAGSLAAVVVLIHAFDHAPFAAALAAFNAVFPVTELQLAERRARALASLEADKLIIATAPREPRWTTATPHRHATVRSMETQLGPLLAQCEAYDAENTPPEAELAVLLAERAAHVAQLEAAWSAFASACFGDAGLGMYLAGDAENMARQLLAGGAPAAAYKLCAAVCWVGHSDRVAIFREVFGL